MKLENLQRTDSAARPACLLIADDLLATHMPSESNPGASVMGAAPTLDNFSGTNLATIVLATNPCTASTVEYMRAGAVAVLAEPWDPDAWLTGCMKPCAWINSASRITVAGKVCQNVRAIQSTQTVGFASHDRGRASKWSAHDLDVSRRTIELDRADILAAFGATTPSNWRGPSAPGSTSTTGKPP